MSRSSARFTAHAQQALNAAQQAAAAARAGQVDVADLLLGLASLPDGTAPALLRSVQFDPSALQAALSGLPRLSGAGDAGPLAVAVRRAIETAHRDAMMDGCERIGSEHLLRGILEVRDSPVTQFLNQQGLTVMRYETALAAARQAGHALSNPGWALDSAHTGLLGSATDALGEAEEAAAPPSPAAPEPPGAATTATAPQGAGGDIVQELLAANQRFLAGGRPQPVAHGAAKGLAILTCGDPRLNGLLEPALGLGRRDAYVLRNAGATIAGNDDVLRSLTVAVHLGGVRRIAVVGHTDCAMGRLDVYQLTTAMQQEGIPRDGIPSLDLRGWLGAFGDLRLAVLDTVDRIRRSPLIPVSVAVCGLVIDTETGSLTPCR